MTEAAKFVDAIVVLKTEIQTEVLHAVNRFEAATGITPSGIDIDMVEMTRMGDRLARFVPGGVRVHLRQL